ncbi:cation-translocating P-type ATPase [Corynebacterium sp.]|uniref:cation-translocating P-type ATPase n=1 Tax=Corynebacterium sp. TaxID=1720 RepID=UPI0026DBB609|nr:cation-translocating P-type ATPase [Corynebacterium sp.]MDO5076459.1 cation-translocating P-type ATPase [Corynebacterium sp.]
MPHAEPFTLDAGDVSAALGVDTHKGLDSEAAAKRLAQHGPNELRAKKPVPLWRKVLKQFQDPLVYLLFVAMGIALAAWWAEGGHGWPVDTVVIGIIVIANAALGYSQEAKAESAVAALASMTAATSTVLRNGRQAQVPSAELVPGDVLLLAEGDAVGADARLVTAAGLTVQEASLTGESLASTKDPQTLAGTVALGDRANMVFKGTAVVQGVGTAVVTATGMDTEMGSIADMLESTAQEESPLEKEIARVSKLLGVLVVVIAVVVMATLALLYQASSAEDWVNILLLGVSLAVAAVPEGLPAILSLVLAIGVQHLARRNAIMKHLHSVETLGAASVICSDKTGTLTRNEMTIQRVLTAAGEVRLTGIGYDPTDGAASGSPTALALARDVVFGGAVANNAQLDADGIVGDPTEAAFLVAWPKLCDDRDPSSVPRDAEIPFSSDRKMMSVRAGDTVFSKGAPDVLAQRCTRLRTTEGDVAFSAEHRQHWNETIEELSAQGYRTLGVATGAAAPDSDAPFAEADFTLLGLVAIIDPPRTEAMEALAQAHSAGIRTLMITGDHPATAQKIALELGLTSTDRALSGTELDALGEAEFNQAVREVDVYARVTPAHKLRIVDTLQAQGAVVAMTGDGVNDAPALKSADIGVAMGITGTEVTKEAATMILADDNYATIVAAVRRGRGIFDNITKFLRYLLSSNMGEVVTVFFGVVLATWLGLRQPGSEEVALPLLATQILWINLVTDSGPALAMGVDPADEDIMKREPRDPRHPIIDADMWKRVLFIGAVMGAATLLTIDMFLPGGFIAGHDSLDTARTAGFTTLVFAQLFNALNARSTLRSAFHQLFDNHWLWASIAVAAALQVAVVNVPLLQTAFGTTALSGEQWCVALAMASTVLWAEELVKLVRRSLYTLYST